MSRLLVLTFLLTAFSRVQAAPIPSIPAESLPKGATARLGALDFRGPNLNGLIFSPDGRTLRAAFGWHLLAWDSTTGKRLPGTQFAPNELEKITGNSAIVGNRHVWLGTRPSNRVDTIDENVVVVSDFKEGGARRFQYPGQVFLPYHELSSPTWLTRASVAADGTRMAVWNEREKALCVYDLSSGKQIRSQQVEVKFAPGIHLAADGRTVFFQEFNKPIRRFDLVTGELLSDLGMAMPSSAQIDTTVDGRLAVIRDRFIMYDQQGRPPTDPDHRTLTVWDLASNKSRGKLTLRGTPQHFRCCGSAALIAVAGECRPGFATRYTVSRWNLDTLKADWEVPCPSADWVAVAPDGQRFVLTDRWHVAQVYDAATGKRHPALAGHASPVVWVGYSPDGGTVITADADDVRTWGRSGNQTGVTPVRGPVPHLTLGGELVWANRDAQKGSELVAWDRAKHRVGWRTALSDAVPDRVYSPDGTRIVGLTWDADKKVWAVSVSDGPTGKRLHAWTMNIEPFDGTWPVAFCDAGRTLFVGSREGLIGLDVATGREKARLEIGPINSVSPGYPFPLAASGDGSRLARVIEVHSDKPSFLVRVYEVQSGRKLAEHALTIAPESGRVYGMEVKFSPDGKKLAVRAGPGTKFVVCDVEGGAKPREFDGGLSRPTCMAFSPNNAEIAVGYQDGTTLLWDLTAK